MSIVVQEREREICLNFNLLGGILSITAPAGAFVDCM